MISVEYHPREARPEKQLHDEFCFSTGDCHDGTRDVLYLTFAYTWADRAFKIQDVASSLEVPLASMQLSK